METPPRDPRSPVTLKIKFKSESLEQFIERYSVDVSRGGIFIRTKEPLAVGTPLKFEFQLQDGSPLISGEGTVVWIREYDPSRSGVAPGMGVRFDKLGGASQPVLDKILSEKARRDQATGLSGARSTSGNIPTPSRKSGSMLAARSAASIPSARQNTPPPVAVPPPAAGSPSPPPAPPMAAGTNEGGFESMPDDGATRVAPPSFDFATIEREMRERREREAKGNGAKLAPLGGLSTAGARNLAAVTLTGFMRDGKPFANQPGGSTPLGPGTAGAPDVLAGPAPQGGTPQPAAVENTLPNAAPPGGSNPNIDALFEDEQMPTPSVVAVPLGADDISQPGARLSAQRAAVGSPGATGSARAPEKRMTASRDSIPALAPPSPAAQPAYSPGSLTASSGRKKPVAIIVAAIVVVLGGAGAAYYFLFMQQPGAEAPGATPAPPRGVAPPGSGRLAPIPPPARAPIPQPPPPTRAAPPAPAPVAPPQVAPPPAPAPAPVRASPAPVPAPAPVRATPVPSPAARPAPGKPAATKPAAARPAAPAPAPAGAAAAGGPPSYILRVNSNPKGAEVLIDGQVVGQTPYIGRDFDHSSAHALTIRAPGFEAHEQMVSSSDNWIRKGKETSLLVFTRLQKIPGAAPAPAAPAATDGKKEEPPKAPSVNEP